MDSSLGIVSSCPFLSLVGYWTRRDESPSAAASDAFVLSIVKKKTPFLKSMPRKNDLNWSRIIESAFTIVRPSGDRWSCSGFVGPTTRTLQPLVALRRLERRNLLEPPIAATARMRQPTSLLHVRGVLELLHHDAR